MGNFVVENDGFDDDCDDVTNIGGLFVHGFMIVIGLCEVVDVVVVVDELVAVPMLCQCDVVGGFFVVLVIKLTGFGGRPFEFMDSDCWECANGRVLNVGLGGLK